MESNANDIHDSFLRGVQGETFEQGFTSDIDEKYANLTPKQQQVLELIRLGNSNKRIRTSVGGGEQKLTV